MLVFSPSNVNAHIQCPLKAYAMRSKQIVWKDSPQKARGTLVHAALETSIREQKPLSIQDPVVNVGYLMTILGELQSFREKHNAEVYAEYEMALAKDFATHTGWWDDNTFIRAKADFVAIPDSKEFVILGDWKTGKMYAEAVQQMATEGLIASCYFGIPIIMWNLFYVDLGETKRGRFDFSISLTQAEKSINAMREMARAEKSGGPYPAKKNPFCKWCDWYHTENCKESMRW